MTRDLKRVLVTDLDNTLWDWFSAWHASFSAMLEALEEDSGVPRSVLESEIRVLHQKYATTEYSNLLSEVPSLLDAAGGVEPWRAFPRAVEALRRERRERTRPYPGVLEAHSYASTSRTLILVALRAGSRLANTARTHAMASHKTRPPTEYT